MPKKRRQPHELPPEIAEAIQRMFLSVEPPPLTAESIAEELAGLPRRPEDWLVVTQPAEVEGMTLYVSLVVSPDSPEPLLFQPLESTDELLRFIVESLGMGEGETGHWEPYVPQRFLVNDPQLAFAWGNLLREAGIGVELGVPPELEKLVAEAAQQFAQMAGGVRALPFLSGQQPEQAAAFIRAFDTFITAQPWQWLDDRPIFVQGQDESGEPLSLYAVVMGHAGQEFGLALFARWTDYLEVVLAGNETEAMAATVAQGGREAVTLARTGEELADEDWAFLQGHRLTRKKRENWSGGVQQRLGLEGALPPHFPLSFVTAMLQVLVKDAPVPAARRDFLTSFKRRSGSFRVSYPATARDELTPEQAHEWVRLRVPVRDRRVPYAQRQATTLEIVAPGDTLLAKAFSPKLFRQLWQSQPDMPKWSKSDLNLLGYDLPDRIYRLVELDGEQQQLYLYSRGEVGPTLAQLLKLSEEKTLYVTSPFDRYSDEYQPIPLQIARVDGPLADAEAEEKGIAMRWSE